MLLTYSGSNGETLGALLLNADDTLGVSAQQIALTEEVADDTQIRELLQDFYKQVADDPKLQAGGERLFSHEALEQDALSGYVGSQACATCHQKEFDQWAHTSHATAFNTLLTVGKQFYPECVSCHVTGFRYETGYQIGNEEKEHLADVGYNENIKRLLPDLNRCANCTASVAPKLPSFRDDFLQIASITRFEKGPAFNPEHESRASFGTFIRPRICVSLMNAKRKECRHQGREQLEPTNGWDPHETADIADDTAIASIPNIPDPTTESFIDALMWKTYLRSCNFPIFVIYYSNQFGWHCYERHLSFLPPSCTHRIRI